MSTRIIEATRTVRIWWRFFWQPAYRRDNHRKAQQWRFLSGRGLNVIEAPIRSCAGGLPAEKAPEMFRAKVQFQLSRTDAAAA